MENIKSLSDYEYIKEFLELLEYHEMKAEKKQLEFIIDYIDHTEKQFQSVLDELQNVKEELGTIQNKSLKTTAIKTADNITNKIQEAQKNIEKIKNHIKKTIRQEVKDFKEKGKSALTVAVKKLHVKGMVSSIKASSDSIMKSADQSIDSITKLGDEIYAANTHFKNIGRMLIGRQVKEVEARNYDKGILHNVQNCLFTVMDKMTILSQRAERMIILIEKQEQSLDKKENSKKDSVKKLLNEIKKNESKKNTSKIKSKER